LQEPESQIILGAAVIDDVIGLIILGMVEGLTHGQEITAVAIAKTTGIAVGFIVVTIVVGRFIVPLFVRWGSRLDLPGTPIMLTVVLAFGLAWLAAAAGSAMIVGAFTAGILLRATPQSHALHRAVAHLGYFFVPIFFVTVGAAVDVRVFNPFDPANHRILLIGGLLIVAAVSGKFLAGYSPFWFRGNKQIIGVGMIPRGEVGLIFAQMGLATGVFDVGMFSAAMLMVLVTTFMTPPLLRLLFSSPPKNQYTSPSTNLLEPPAPRPP
jgi:Kef-type K+ transport system membrane component KefB